MPSGINEGIKWSMLELRGLVEDEDVRVFYQRAQKHLGLYPFHLKDLNTAIREILNSTINCYDNEYVLTVDRAVFVPSKLLIVEF